MECDIQTRHANDRPKSTLWLLESTVVTCCVGQTVQWRPTIDGWGSFSNAKTYKRSYYGPCQWVFPVKRSRLPRGASDIASPCTSVYMLVLMLAHCCVCGSNCGKRNLRQTLELRQRVQQEDEALCISTIHRYSVVYTAHV